MSSFQKYFYLQVGYRIRYYRLLRGLTQEELSQILELNEKYIGHVERCERYISCKVLIKLMNYFNINPTEFFDFDKKYFDN